MADGSLVGNIYIGMESAKSKAAGELVVTRDPGGEYVWVDGVQPPHRPRRIRRDRLLTPRKYRFLGRVEAPIVEGRRVTPPPVFDGPGFAVWLRRIMDAEGMAVSDLSERSGLHASMLATLRRGIPSSTQQAQGQRAINPSINTIAAVAHGLGLELSYVMSKAGLDNAGDRWANFSDREAEALAVLLDCEIDELDASLRELVTPTRMKELA